MTKPSIAAEELAHRLFPAFFHGGRVPGLGSDEGTSESDLAGWFDRDPRVRELVAGVRRALDTPFEPDKWRGELEAALAAWLPRKDEHDQG